MDRDAAVSSSAAKAAMAPMFTELVFETSRSHTDSLGDRLLAAGALSVSVEDADAGLADEEPLFGEPGTANAVAARNGESPAGAALAWKRSRVVALFDAVTDCYAALNEACDEAGVGRIPNTIRRAVADADWVRMTQSQFEPIHVGERLWIVPSWHEPPGEAGATNAIVLRLDPGLAFGTGSHPTTRLCLAWLEANLRAGQTLIDYGCGSGILAIAAKKLGASKVAGTDLDAQALTASKENAAANQCDVEFVPTDALSSLAGASRQADIVVANILSNPLKVLAPLLCGLVAPGGRLVLCGILERQWKEVAECYGESIALEVWRTEEEWVCLAGRKGFDSSRQPGRVQDGGS